MMNTRMDGKTVVVTGASSGIGRATAKALAARGAHIVMVFRESGRAANAYREVRGASTGGTVDLLLCDLSSLQSVRECGVRFRERHKRCDVLINNAGIYLSKRQVTVDSFETTFAVNHLSHFLLTHLLLDVLKNSAPSRIITVSSQAHRVGGINIDDLQSQKRYSAFRAYQQSKLANVLFTYELARRLDPSQVTANALHPGVVRTRFGQTDNGFMKIGVKLAGFMMISPDKGALTSVYLASSPDVAGTTGQYFMRCRPARSSRISYDREAAGRLWKASERLCGISGESDGQE
jgi:NAD(P)-dependent dehydrogenase (short-subunit alcohol dehydrogenase family)